MARTLIEGLRAAVRRHALLSPGDIVLVAVSGGADSVALLCALIELRDELAVGVAAAHLDHRLRGEESAADRRFVDALAARLGVPCVSDAGDVPAGNLEAEARRVRYAFLEAAADRVGATKIATAHTRDDQAETVLLRLLRGAGRRGLGGIRPRRGRIVRPLLLCDRMQVRAFLVERGLEWRRDHSNFDLASERARVRHGFLPALARELNPRLSANLAELADVMRDEDALLDRLAAATARRATLAVDVLTALEPPLARRAVQQWWRRHGNGRRIGRAHVDTIRQVAERASDDGEVAVPGGTVVRAARGLTFRPGRPPALRTDSYRLALEPGAEARTPNGWTLSLTEATTSAVERGDTVCVLDADSVRNLEVRSRLPGDRLRLHGLAGHTSIKRLLNARAVPRHLRSDYPLVIADGEVLWVPGCARSDRALVGPETTRCYVIRLTRTPNESA
jgi:tRNA(Ile)-lysidine synthase